MPLATSAGLIRLPPYRITPVIPGVPSAQITDAQLIEAAPASRVVRHENAVLAPVLGTRGVLYHLFWPFTPEASLTARDIEDMPDPTSGQPLYVRRSPSGSWGVPNGLVKSPRTLVVSLATASSGSGQTLYGSWDDPGGGPVFTAVGITDFEGIADDLAAALPGVEIVVHFNTDMLSLVHSLPSDNWTGDLFEPDAAKFTGGRTMFWVATYENVAVNYDPVTSGPAKTAWSNLAAAYIAVAYRAYGRSDAPDDGNTTAHWGSVPGVSAGAADFADDDEVLAAILADAIPFFS